MAIYIHIERIDEDSDSAIYQFGFAHKVNNEIVIRRVEGRISINRNTGDIQLLHIDNKDNKEKKEFFLERVSLVLKRHFEAGEFPETTHYIA